MMDFETFGTTPRIIMGNGSLSALGGELARLNADSILIVTDSGVVKAGIIARVEEVLHANAISFSCFDKVVADPPFDLVDDALALLRQSGAKAVIGIGGGSALDIAKVVSIAATNDGPIAELFGIDLVKKPGIPLILVPTTAGTGSEVTPIVILSDPYEKLKKGIVSPYLHPSCALLDPSLTVGLPPAVTAATGMDALIHAIEAYTSKNATFLTDILAKEAMHLLFSNIRKAVADGSDMKARENMLRGSLLAGMAFANAGVTAVHAFAYPIGAEFHIPHGVANTIMLIPVMQFNMIGCLERIAKLADFFEIPTGGLSVREVAQKVIDTLDELSNDLRVPRHLKDFGIHEEVVPELAAGVLKVTRLLANNPRKLLQQDAEAIYRAVL